HRLRGGRGRRPGVARGGLRGLALHRHRADIRGGDRLLDRRPHQRLAGGAGAALPHHGRDPDRAAAGVAGDARIVTRGSRERLVLWAAYAAVLVVAPIVFSKGFALTLLCQMGIVMIFALSYNMLLGQTGLLSFGHAVYYGLGALFTIHALNL